MSEQLALPLPEIPSLPTRVGIPRSQRVFVNRNLKMSGIDWVGFEIDDTLAVYDRDVMDRLVIEAAFSKLIDRGYPAPIAELTVRARFPIRGLLIDTRLGHILKTDRHKVVQKGYHGMRQLSREEIRSLYHSRKIRPIAPRYVWIDTRDALSEAAMYAGVVDGLEVRGVAVDYERLAIDIRACIEQVRADGTAAERVLGDIGCCVRRDPMLASTLHKLRSAGKRLFLLTNSSWRFTHEMMRALLDDAMPEYPSWRHYFDVIVCAASKPAFFRERHPFAEREVEGGRDHGQSPSLRPATHIERGHVYEGGNLLDFERMLGVTGDRILYIADHIHGDMFRPKRESSWRTAMILQEMEAEISACEASAEDSRQFGELSARRDQLEDELRANQALFKDLSRRIDAAAVAGEASAGLETNRARVKRAVERVRMLMRRVDLEMELLETSIDRRFHPYWGSLLKEGTEMSSFGDQVQTYACAYTSRVSNFLAYSPLQYFRSPRDLMPHET